jgi:hypothetical protein
MDGSIGGLFLLVKGYFAPPPVASLKNVTEGGDILGNVAS